MMLYLRDEAEQLKRIVDGIIFDFSVTPSKMRRW